MSNSFIRNIPNKLYLFGQCSNELKQKIKDEIKNNKLL